MLDWRGSLPATDQLLPTPAAAILQRFDGSGDFVDSRFLSPNVGQEQQKWIQIQQM